MNRVQNASNGNHKRVTSKTSLVILLPFVFRVALLAQKSEVSETDSLAKRNSVRCKLFSVNINDLRKSIDKTVDINLIHDFEEVSQDSTQVWPDQVGYLLVVQHLCQSKGCFDSNDDVLIVQVIDNFLTSFEQMAWITELKPSVLAIHPAGTALHEGIVTLQTGVGITLENGLNGIVDLRSSRILILLVERAKCVQKGLTSLDVVAVLL